MTLNRPIIIAEAGVNHNGSLQTALKMVDAAADANVDYIKFQTFKAERLVTAESRTASYQKNNCDADSQLEMLRRLELGFDDFRTIHDYCAERNIGFLSTPFDAESIAFLASLDMDFFKVPSGEITNLPYLRMVAATGIPPVISTGMSTVAEIEAALEVFFMAGHSRDGIILLHCNTEYPTPFSDVNLRAMRNMAETFGVPAGYSDHTPGIEIPIAATALGACLIEKHFTLDRSMPGPDHVASLQPDELAAMVSAIHNVAAALGSPLKRVSDSERKNIPVARKSIVAASEINAGELFSEKNLTVKRPGSGISPMRWDEIIGRPAPAHFAPDEPIFI